MQTWINFFNVIFWITLVGFLVNLENFFKILLYSELTWISLYCYTTLTGSINNDLTLLGTSFYVLGLAGIEFSIGILMVILFKNLNKSISFDNFIKNNKISNLKKSSINKFYFNN